MPPWLQDSGIPQLTEVRPDGEIQFTVSLEGLLPDPPDIYVVAYVSSWWVEEGGRDYNGTGAATYTQLHTCEMQTPADVETWSEVNTRYE